MNWGIGGIRRLPGLNEGVALAASLADEGEEFAVSRILSYVEVKVRRFHSPGHVGDDEAVTGQTHPVTDLTVDAIQFRRMRPIVPLRDSLGHGGRLVLVERLVLKFPSGDGNGVGRRKQSRHVLGIELGLIVHLGEDHNLV